MDKAARELNDNELDDHCWQLRLDNGEVMSFHNQSIWMIHRPSWLGIKRYAMEHWLGNHAKKYISRIVVVFLLCENLNNHCLLMVTTIGSVVCIFIVIEINDEIVMANPASRA